MPRPGAGEPPGRDAILAALADAYGRASVAAERLGLRNRFVLYRLMNKYGIRPPTSDPGFTASTRADRHEARAGTGSAAREDAA